MAVAAIAVPAGANALPPAAARTASVTLKDIRFTPRTVTLARGGRVTWHWRDGDVTHNVTIKGSKHSPDKQSGTFTVHFTHSGTFRYRCTLHPGMTGKVLVR